MYGCGSEMSSLYFSKDWRRGINFFSFTAFSSSVVFVASLVLRKIGFPAQSSIFIFPRSSAFLASLSGSKGVTSSIVLKLNSPSCGGCVDVSAPRPASAPVLGCPPDGSAIAFIFKLNK